MGDLGCPLGAIAALASAVRVLLLDECLLILPVSCCRLAHTLAITSVVQCWFL
jgi:hypothetical protein